MTLTVRIRLMMLLLGRLLRDGVTAAGMAEADKMWQQIIEQTRKERS